MLDFELESKKQFKKLFQSQDIHCLRAAIDSAYEAVEQLYTSQVMENFLLDTIIGQKDVRPHILRAAIASFTKKYCQKGYLEFLYTEESNKAKNCRHVRLEKDNCSLYIARVEWPEEIPHKALYRPTIGDIEINLFEPTKWEPNKISTFTATYGDRGKNTFQFGNIGVLGSSNWWYCEPLDRGAYSVISDNDEEEVLVELNEEFLNMVKKRDENGGK